MNLNPYQKGVFPLLPSPSAYIRVCTSCSLYLFIAALHFRFSFSESLSLCLCLSPSWLSLQHSPLRTLKNFSSYSPCSPFVFLVFIVFFPTFFSLLAPSRHLSPPPSTSSFSLPRRCRLAYNWSKSKFHFGVFVPFFALASTPTSAPIYSTQSVSFCFSTALSECSFLCVNLREGTFCIRVCMCICIRVWVHACARVCMCACDFSGVCLCLLSLIRLCVQMRACSGFYFYLFLFYEKYSLLRSHNMFFFFCVYSGIFISTHAQPSYIKEFSFFLNILVSCLILVCVSSLISPYISV